MLKLSNIQFQLPRWCVRAKEINEFFTIIKRELPEIRKGAFDEAIVDGKIIDSVFLATTPDKPFKAIDSGYLINSKDYK